MKEIVWRSVFNALSFKRVVNLMRVLYSLAASTISRKSIIWGVPPVLTIEPTVLCNLKCPQCITGMGKAEREQAYFPFKLYRQIIEQIGDKLWYLLLYNQGEPFLHDRLLEFIALAKQKRIYVTISTNGHFFEDEKFIQQLVGTGLDSVIISLDGADDNTYSQYRHGGEFDKVIKGIKQFVKTRQQLDSRLPKIFIQFLVMKHNEHQLVKMRKLARGLGVDRLLIKTIHIENPAHAGTYLPQRSALSRYSMDRDNFRLKNQVTTGCARLWYSTVVLSDGRVVPCCFDKNGKYALGQITNSRDIQQIWKSHEYRKFRTEILRARKSHDICNNCTQNQKVYF